MRNAPKKNSRKKLSPKSAACFLRRLDFLLKLNIIDPESDDSIEITNDLMIYQNIIEKINEREDV